MDIANWGNKAKNWIFKFRYPILVLLVGLVLITIPSKVRNNAEPQTDPVIPTRVSSDTAQQLTEILQQIKGVGKVKVLLTHDGAGGLRANVTSVVRVRTKGQPLQIPELPPHTKKVKLQTADGPMSVIVSWPADEKAPVP